MKTFEVGVWQEYGGYYKVRVDRKELALDRVQEMIDAGEDPFADPVNIRITYEHTHPLDDVKEV